MTPSTTMPAAALAALTAHFSSRYTDRDDAAHLATYAPGAFLVVGDRVVKRTEAEPTVVLDAWASVPDTGPPHFEPPRCLRWDSQGPDAGMAVVETREAASREPLSMAVGLSLHDGDWQVTWATVLEGEPLPFERQAVAALSEMAGLKAATLDGPLVSLLEVSYSRLHRLPRQRLLALPETQFSCAGTGACCRHEMTVGLDEPSRTFIEAVDWPSVAPHLDEGPYVEALPEAAKELVSFRHRLARAADGRCRFLTEDNRCSVHALVGRAVFKPCHVFPYRFSWSPDGICVTTHSMCPTARHAKGQPLAAQEGELRARLAVADVLTTERYMLRPGQEVPWETFRTIEGQLIEHLAGDGPIKQKLWVALRWLEQRLKDPGAGVEAAWLEETIQPLGWLGRAGVQRFGALFDPCFKDLRGVAAGAMILPEAEAELTRFFRSLLFSKVTSYPYGLVAGLNYVVLVHQVLERQVERHAARGISEPFWQEFYAVITSGTFFRMLAVFHGTPATFFARQSESPAFGMSLLRL